MRPSPPTRGRSRARRRARGPRRRIRPTRRSSRRANSRPSDRSWSSARSAWRPASGAGPGPTSRARPGRPRPTRCSRCRRATVPLAADLHSARGHHHHRRRRARGSIQADRRHHACTSRAVRRVSEMGRSPGGCRGSPSRSRTRSRRGHTMRALVYHGPGVKACEEVAKPRSSTTRTRSCASTRPRSAGRTSTS